MPSTRSGWRSRSIAARRLRRRARSGARRARRGAAGRGPRAARPGPPRSWCVARPTTASLLRAKPRRAAPLARSIATTTATPSATPSTISAVWSGRRSRSRRPVRSRARGITRAARPRSSARGRRAPRPRGCGWRAAASCRRARVSASSRPITAAPVASSRLPVGSSASTRRGSRTSARAIATRCCSPPESRSGKLARSVREADARRGAPRRARRVLTRELRRQQHVLEHAERRDQVEELEHEADLVAAQQRALARVRGG